MRKMKIIKSLHVTATEKRHLKAFLDSGLTFAKMNTKYYEILKGTPQKNGYEYEIRITTKRKNDFGEVRYERQNITLITN